MEKVTKYEIFPIDCIKGMKAMGDGSVDVVVTSPPYNLGIKYKKFKDTQTRGDYLNWCRDWGCEIMRLLSSEGSFFLNVSGKPSDPLVPHQVLDAMLSVGFTLQNTFHWVKSVTVPNPEDGDDYSPGHFKPINSPRFVNDCHEFIYHFTKLGKVKLNRLAIGVPYEDKTNLTRGTRGKNGDLRCRGNQWFIPYPTIQNRDIQRPHPATFPVLLASQCILVHGIERCSRVLDPFMGIGSTGIAAVREEIDFVGFEMDSDYCIEAARRIENALQSTNALS